jgi:hypothetical protein
MVSPVCVNLVQIMHNNWSYLFAFIHTEAKHRELHVTLCRGKATNLGRVF